MNIIPKPQIMVLTKGKLQHKKKFITIVEGNPELPILAIEKLKRDFPSISFSNNGVGILFLEDQQLKEDQYQLVIDKERISIKYKTSGGAFNAVCSLKQIFNNSLEYEIDGVIIDDYPDFKNRGLMLDISRNRVYKVETFYKIIDFISDLKINQLQFNVEGNSFYYPSKESYYENKDQMLTKEDIMKIDKYAKMNGVELIPNQNSFGHMSYWLNQPEYNHLAECPEGFTYKWMINSPSSTLNPSLNESFEFVTNLYDEYLPSFSSNTMNIGVDEPFELGFGASKDIVEKEGKAAVYATFVNKLYKNLKEKGYKTMMWGDVIKNHPETLELLPNDIIALEWGYDKNDFKPEDLQKYVDQGFDFYVAPGTSMWNSIVGIHDNMLQNIKRAAKLGRQFGAAGLLNTDWGDGGSWQQLSLSYFPYAIGAVYSWNSNTDQDDSVLDYLDKSVFKDESGRLSRLMLSLGNAYQIEKIKADNATQLFRLLYLQQTDHINFGKSLSDPMFIIKDERLLTLNEYQKYEKFFTNALKEVNEIEFNAEDNEVIREELLFSIKILLVGSQLGQTLVDLYGHDLKKFKEMTKMYNEALKHYEVAWNNRNKESDYKLSTLRMVDLKNKLEAIIKNH